MRPDNIKAAEHFIALATTGDAPSSEQLSRALDELALSYYDTPAGLPDEEAADPPAFAKENLGERFPSYGFYAVADPNEVVESEPMVGDAIDDLTDIVSDLRKIVWRYDNIGAADAHWHFRLLFQAHWGEHLRNLLRYLHAKQFD